MRQLSGAPRVMFPDTTMLIIRLLSTRLKLLAMIWLVAEALVFLAVVKLIGFGWALLAGLATTLIGASLLKRVGASAMMRLRGSLGGRHHQPQDALEGTLAAVSAAALMLPGFISDGLGLVLAVPAVRSRVARWVRDGGLGIRFEAGSGSSGTQVIDLDRDEWTRTRPSGEGGEMLR